ncbi:hypothetical protein [Arcobacter sp. FWKO B]|uniref:hypothetical protein n=1 Tax=Arcobacter sp. FWKO B TaxID=2593672 RepID=UPI0018A56DE4|nr:hypothetical protein [Arcobacter sp. FWKO B]QOG11592.1 hypothetical protein FWKOB_02260 [Arcobacter sp. FWKO B]
MILNISKIKTEALLLFAKELIKSYINNNEKIFFVDENTTQIVENKTYELYTQIVKSIHKDEFYTSGTNIHARLVMKHFEYLNKLIAKELNMGEPFNPSVLLFSLLATWFLELGHESKSKEYLYFSLFTYGEIYDLMFVNTKDVAYKAMNIKMVDIAERIIYKYDNVRL